MGKRGGKKGRSKRSRKDNRERRSLNDFNDPGGLKRAWYNRPMDRARRFMMNAEQTLGTPNWSEMNLEPIQKNFYQEHPLVTERDMDTVRKYRDENRITVTGGSCPKPVLAFGELNFPEKIMAAIKEQNFDSPTPIQSQALPIAMSGKDMIGIAETGSGKTLAFILPAIIHISEKQYTRNFGEPDVVVLAPTRELAQQIHEVVVNLGPGIQVTSECFYGGVKRAEQMVCAEKVFEICIGTPGRMADFLSEGLIKLHKCTYFVLDEADRMLDMGFEPQIRVVINQTRPDRQMLMFSATWPKDVKDLAEKYLKDYIMVNIGSLQMSANHNITQKVIVCEDSEKQDEIVKIMNNVMPEEENKTLIFCNSKVEVDYLTLKFRLNGWDACGLHGNMKQREREDVFGKFKTGNIRLLIATDLAARGLDVDDIKFIVNYDYPNCSADYVHRIGRTGRCNRTGTAITFFTKSNWEQAKQLISVLQEANQEINPQLQDLISPYKPIKVKREKDEMRRNLKLRKKEMKQLVKRRSIINKIPLGTETNTEFLPDLDGVALPPDLVGPDKISKWKKRSRSATKELAGGDQKDDVPLEKPQKKKKVKHCPSTDHPVPKGLPMGPISMGMPMHPGNMNMPMHPGNMNMPMRPGNMNMPMRPGNMNMPMHPGNMNMPMRPGNMGMPMDPRNMGRFMGPRGGGPMPPGVRRDYAGPPQNQGYNSMGWPGEPGRGSLSYDAYRGHQNSNLGGYRSRYSLDRRPDANQYSTQSWP